MTRGYSTLDLNLPRSVTPVPPATPTYTVHTDPGQQRADNTNLFWNGSIGETARLNLAVPLSQSLPPDLMARVDQVSRQLPLGPRQDFRLARIDQAVQWIDAWNWPKGELGNPVVTRAQTLAQSYNIPVSRFSAWALWMPFPFKAPPSGLASPYAFFPPPNRAPTLPPREVQLDCLRMVLDLRDGGIANERQAGMEAWATGDVDHAIKRSGVAQLCLFGRSPSSDAAAFWDRQAYTYMTYLDQAFDKPGFRVALVEFDPLLMAGGVLDHYRQLGYAVELER
ncbi:MAG: hypothetical protein JWM33_1039 [Caulobacteraceae bacterium]|nr:hypothetical protein [Caulobacteraceae bacterium]